MDFRFFVNVDSCISDEGYGCFFYKNRSEKHLRLYSPSIMNDSDDDKSFKVQAADIHSYINRIPHFLGEYQIIFSIMRDVPRGELWEQSLLQMMIDIDYYLRNAGIVDDFGVVGDCCISIFAINKLRVNEIVQNNTAHYIQNTFSDECKFLGSEFGIFTDKPISDKEFNDFMLIFEKKYNANKESLKSLFRRMRSYANANNVICIEDYIKEHIVKNFLINELFVNDAIPSEEMCALFRIIEYTNSDVPRPENNTKSYKELCVDHWNSIVNLPSLAIESKYAAILKTYKNNLEQYYNTIANTGISVNGLSIMPSLHIPDEDSIICDDEQNIFYNQDNVEKNLSKPENLINDYIKKLPSCESLSNEWIDTYSKLMEYADDLKRQLDRYGSALKNKYIDNLEAREREEVVQRNKVFDIDDHTTDEIADLELERIEVLEELKESQVAPQILYQNQLSLENKIKTANENVTFYIDCILAVSRRSFWALIAILSSFVLLFYVLLQPSILLITGIGIAAAYIAAVIVLMSLCWSLPNQRYKDCIEKELIKLKKDIRPNLENYSKNAIKLRQYVNYCNMLDYIERETARRKKAVQDSSRRETARRYYLTEAASHYDHMRIFDGLINNRAVGNAVQNSNAKSYPPIDAKGFVIDVVDCQLFWPC